MTAQLFAVLGSAGFLGGLGVLLRIRHEIRKLRAEAHHLDVEAAATEDRADDEHTAALTERWKDLIAAQTEAVVKPLRDEVERQAGQIVTLRDEMSTMRAEFEALRTRYWRAITYVRALLTWVHRHHDQPAGLPSAPAEIAADI
jgi:predicted RNase H-like nuclease (RuvC/YqgF family)